MRCCVDLVRFVLFLANLLSCLGFIALISGTVYVLLRGEDTFIGQRIEPDLNVGNPTAIYFTIIIIILVVSSFLTLFTFLGCCGTAYKSSCMIGSFIVILFVLFGGSVGGLIFLHYQYGSQAIKEILEQELSRSVSGYRLDAVLTPLFWNWLLATAQCCGVGQEGWTVWKTAQLKDKWTIPEACCRPEFPDCMYEPSVESAHLTDCVPGILGPVQMVAYGLPSLMLVTLLFAFIVAASVNRQERRKVETRPYHSHSQYSVGAEEDFQHQSYASAPENPPYNPQFELSHHRDVGMYPVGTVPPPHHHHHQATTPLLHDAPPSYNEIFIRGK